MGRKPRGKGGPSGSLCARREGEGAGEGRGGQGAMHRDGGARGTKAPLWGRGERVAPSATGTFWGGALPLLSFLLLPGPCLAAGGAGRGGGCRVFSAGVPMGGRLRGGFSPPHLPFTDAPGLPPRPPSSPLSGEKECLRLGGLWGRCFLLWRAVGAGVDGRGRVRVGGTRSSAPFPGVAAFCYLPGKITARVRLSSRSVCL